MTGERWELGAGSASGEWNGEDEESGGRKEWRRVEEEGRKEGRTEGRVEGAVMEEWYRGRRRGEVE